LVFGEVAETYDRVRPSYPVEFFDDIFSFAGLKPGTPAQLCESGAGTGKATMIVAPFAASSGWSLTCVEPDPTMAGVLDRNLAAVAGLDYSIVASGLEDFADGLGPDPTGARRFGLLFAAQSWHWVSPERRALDAATVLVDSGTLALVWNVARPHPPDLQRALDEVYGGVMPPREWEPDATDRLDCTPRSARVEALSGRVRREYADELEASGLFEPVTIVSRHWRSSHPTDEWLSLLQTHSDHRMLAEDVRAALLERVRHAVDAHGARVDVDYDAVAILTRRLARRSLLPP
jgi:SAM-dependent methyltransferase